MLVWNFLEWNRMSMNGLPVNQFPTLCMYIIIIVIPQGQLCQLIQLNVQDIVICPEVSAENYSEKHY